MFTTHKLTVLDASLLICYTEYLTKYSSDLKGLTKARIISKFFAWYESDNTYQLKIDLSIIPDEDVRLLFHHSKV